MAITEELVGFLLARFNEDSEHVRLMGDFWMDTMDEVTGDAVRHFTDEDRLCREVEVKRRIAEWARSVQHGLARAHVHPMDRTTGAAAALREVLRLLALPYRDHPDYRPEWSPNGSPSASG